MDAAVGSKRPRIAEHCQISTAVIIAKVEERETARRAKNFQFSDFKRDELRDIGVDLIDKARIWKSSDGRVGLLTTERLKKDACQELVSLRETERANKNFETADRIRDILRDGGGVTCDDQRGLWSSSDGFSGACNAAAIGSASSSAATGVPTPTYASSAAAGMPPAGASSELELLVLVQQLEEARTRGDLHVQHALRVLLHAKGVAIDDTQWTWRDVSGRSGPLHHAVPQLYHAALQRAAATYQQEATRLSVAPHGYPPAQAQVLAQAYPPYQSLDPATTDVDAIIYRREQERRTKNFGVADQLREQLRGIGVEPNDKQSCYTLPDGTTKPYPVLQK